MPLECALKTAAEEHMEHVPLLPHSKVCAEDMYQYLYKKDGAKVHDEGDLLESISKSHIQCAHQT